LKHKESLPTEIPFAIVILNTLHDEGIGSYAVFQGLIVQFQPPGPIRFSFSPLPYLRPKQADFKSIFFSLKISEKGKIFKRRRKGYRE
jgi:hypothetical protein